MRERVCKNCGGREYKVVGQNMVKCAFCGTLYVNEHALKEEDVLIVGANEIQRALRFDDAVVEFDKILSYFPLSFEGYFGRALAKNKIICYTNKKGTSRRPRFFKKVVSILDDEDYQKALELAPDESKADFQKQARRIEKIKKKYEEISVKNEYDVILCVAKEEKEILEKAQKIVENLEKSGKKVYFLQNLTQKEGEEDTFRALETSRVMVLFANSKNGYFEFKHLFDRYLYFINRKEKTQSSFVCATCEENFASLPRELSFCKNYVDLNSKTFVQDVEDVVKREIEKSIKETAKIETIKLDKVQPQKKEYINLETISPQELGNYEVHNIAVDNQNKIQWIYLTLKNSDFETARKLIDEELENQPYSSELLFAQLLAEKKIKTPEDFFSSISNFNDKEKIDNILRYASKNFAENFVDGWENLIEELNDEDYYIKYLTYLATYFSPNRENFIQSAQNLAIESQNEELIEDVLKCFDPKDVDRFISFYFSLAQAMDSEKYYRKILEIDPGHAPSNIALFLHKFKTTIDILTYRNAEEIENMLKYFSDENIFNFVDKVVDMILSVAFIDLEQAQKQIDFYIAYINNEKDLSSICVKIAKKFQEFFFFKQAERYLAIAISKDQNNFKLYWTLIQVKAHCRSDNELIISNVKVIEFPEWGTLLSLADDKHKEFYAEIASKGNLYKGTRVAFKEDLPDKVHLVTKLQEFLSRNEKVLLEYEMENAEVSKYFHVQFVPFESYLKELENIETFGEYYDMVEKIERRLDALDLNLDMSVNVLKLDEKMGKATKVVNSENEIEPRKKEKNKKILWTALCVVFEVFPLCFTTILFLLTAIIPKNIYMNFSQNFLISSLVYCVFIALGNFVAYVILKKRRTLKQRLYFLIFSVIGALDFLLFCFAFYPSTQIEISNAKELQALLKNAPYANFVLTDDIDFDGQEWKSCNFYGSLDGQNFEISNIKLTSSFFEKNSGEIQSLTITVQDVTLKNVSLFGILASSNTGTITDCTVNGNITISTELDAVIGGMVGKNSGEITLSESDVTFIVEAQNNVNLGGLVGQISSSSAKIYQNLVTVHIDLNVDNVEEINVGGLIGFSNVNSEIAENSVQVNIDVSGSATNVNLGGLVGYGSNSSHDNHTSGTISTEDSLTNGYVGGLYGQYVNSSLENSILHSYSQVEISSRLTCGTIVGGLAGTIEYCFSDQTDFQVYGERLTTAGRTSHCENVTEYDAEFGFDEKIWEIDENSFPKLIWEI